MVVGGGEGFTFVPVNTTSRLSQLHFEPHPIQIRPRIRKKSSDTDLDLAKMMRFLGSATQITYEHV